MPKPEHLGGSDLQNSAAGLRQATRRCSQASPKSQETSLGDKSFQIQDGICSCPYTNAKNRCQQCIQLCRGTASFFPSHLGPQFCPLSNSLCVYKRACLLLTWVSRIFTTILRGRYSYFCFTDEKFKFREIKTFVLRHSERTRN